MAIKAMGDKGDEIALTPLRLARERNRMKRPSAAKHLGIGDSYLGRLESGRVPVPLHILARATWLYRRTLDSLLGDTLSESQRKQIDERRNNFSVYEKGMIPGMKKARLLAGFADRKKAAKKLGISEGYLRRMECPNAVVSYYLACVAERAYGCGMLDLIGWKPDLTPAEKKRLEAEAKTQMKPRPSRSRPAAFREEPTPPPPPIFPTTFRNRSPFRPR